MTCWWVATFTDQTFVAFEDDLVGLEAYDSRREKSLLETPAQYEISCNHGFAKKVRHPPSSIKQSVPAKMSMLRSLTEEQLVTETVRVNHDLFMRTPTPSSVREEAPCVVIKGIRSDGEVAVAINATHAGNLQAYVVLVILYDTQ